MNRILSCKRLGLLGKFFRLHSCVFISVGSSSAHLLPIWSARKVTDNPTEPDASPDHQRVKTVKCPLTKRVIKAAVLVNIADNEQLLGLIKKAYVKSL